MSAAVLAPVLGPAAASVGLQASAAAGMTQTAIRTFTETQQRRGSHPALRRYKPGLFSVALAAATLQTV